MSVLVALLLDALWREPPGSVHPVRAMGAYLDAASRKIPAAPPRLARAAGAAGWLVGALAVVIGAVVTERGLRRLPNPVRSLATGTALWPLLSLQLLLDEVDGVETALATTGLDAARDRVAGLVSRDTMDLSPTEVRAAALESLAENLSDGAVGPLLWYAAGGLPAAAAYRYVNTADAMWGYPDARWRWAGTVAARADDLANLLPARVTALLLAGRTVQPAALRSEAGRTTSPNAGWPMAALALHLGVRLPKRDAYVLHAGGRDPNPADTVVAIRRAQRVGVIAGLAAAVLSGWRNG